MDKRYFVGFLEVNTIAITASYNGGLHWFNNINEARECYMSPPLAEGAYNIIVLGEHANYPAKKEMIIECRPA